MKTFGIEWGKKGRFLVGTLWVIEPGKAPVDLPHRLTLPESLWPEYKILFQNLGAIMDAAGLVDGAGSLVDEVQDEPTVRTMRPKALKAGR